VLDSINGFDTKIVFYGEDTDIARRAAKYSTTKFNLRLVMPTSARRFVGEGMFKAAYIYITNFLSQAIFHTSATKTYKDFR
jgi:GT2 family glycosyltransferase